MHLSSAFNPSSVPETKTLSTPPTAFPSMLIVDGLSVKC